MAGMSFAMSFATIQFQHQPDTQSHSFTQCAHLSMISSNVTWRQNESWLQTANKKGKVQIGRNSLFLGEMNV